MTALGSRTDDDSRDIQHRNQWFPGGFLWQVPLRHPRAQLKSSIASVTSVVTRVNYQSVNINKFYVSLKYGSDIAITQNPIKKNKKKLNKLFSSSLCPTQIRLSSRLCTNKLRQYCCIVVINVLDDLSLSLFVQIRRHE